ncbi:hypothetical protein [Alteromonas sp. 14N.309.X.WAT.G.H12]|uniref:hypothetical protein n=1 Tax=Alteromonas sp. 14N.309.X.WAT.G.H12 TaxID=3120824 RepID=UPI002FD15904
MKHPQVIIMFALACFASIPAYADPKLAGTYTGYSSIEMTAADAPKDIKIY